MKKLYNIREEIYNMKTREECLKDCITEKLNVSLHNFNKEIYSVCDELSVVGNSFYVLKSMIKNQEPKEK